MQRGVERVLNRTDVETALAALADRLRLHAVAVRGMAAAEGDRTSIEARAKAALAATLDAEATRLGLLCAHLCSYCRLIEVNERLSIGGATARVRGAVRKGRDKSAR